MATQYSAKPLLNRTIMVACSAKKMVELTVGLEAMGGSVLPFPVIEVKEIEDKQLLNQALASLNEYSWIIFTSAHGVSFFLQRLHECRITAGVQSMPPICAIGPATAKAVNEFGYEVALVPEKFIAEGVVEALGKVCGGLPSLAGRRILLARAEEGRELLPAELRAAGARVDVVPCYRTVRADLEGDALQQLCSAKPDLIVFTSSSAVRNMIEIFGHGEGTRMLLESAVAVIGPVTGSTVELLGKHAEIVPKENTIASLLEAIRNFYSSRRQE